MLLKPLEGDLYPRPDDRPRVAEALGRIVKELRGSVGDIERAVARSRQGGDRYSNMVGGLAGPAGKILSGLGRLGGAGDIGKVRGAATNIPGVRAQLNAALGLSNDPNTDPGQVDFESANRAAGFLADGITRESHSLNNLPGPGDDTDTGPPEI